MPYVQSLASQDPARAVEQVEELLLGHQISSTDALQVLLLILEQENETSIRMEDCIQDWTYGVALPYCEHGTCNQTLGFHSQNAG